MKLGVYTAILHDRPLAEALDVIASLGLTGAEVNAGGFLPAPHLPVADLLDGSLAAADYLAVFEKAGLELTGLNVNGNVLHPDSAVSGPDAEELERAIRVAGLLGVGRVVAMSGLPAAEPVGTVPAWNVVPWDSAYLDSLEYQWELAAEFWRRIDALAVEHGVKVCLEMHPHNLVFNPATLRRLVERIGARALGAELDPSHLFWQGIDPVAAVEDLGELVFHAAAKDTRINDRARVNGVLDDRFTRVTRDPVSLGGRYTLNAWPPASSWDFVAVGRGHDTAWWTEFLRALRKVDPDMAVNIEHEDLELGTLDGLQVAAAALMKAAAGA
ncbi:sugar phosphate isomerase/epimerase family protein [Amycolatopsis sp. NPDC003865]